MDIIDELADIAADLRSYVELESLRGASAFPVEEVKAVDLGPLPVTRATRPSIPIRNPPVVLTVPPSAISTKRKKAEKIAVSPPVPSRWAALETRPSSTVRESLGTGGPEHAESLDQLREVLGPCTRCTLCAGRSHLVFGTGSPGARLMVVGEAPDVQEDRQGEPFVGSAGKMLDRMVENVLGLGREQIYITNFVKCHPPENRNPEPAEVARCRPFLLHQIRIVRPEFLLVLGGVACQAVFGPEEGVTRLQGQWQVVEYPGGKVRAMPSFHPDHLLRNPQDKRLSFDDLKAVKLAMEDVDG